MIEPVGSVRQVVCIAVLLATIGIAPAPLRATCPNFGTATNISAGAEPSSVAFGDFNRDGKLDLAIANASSDNVSVRLGDGTGAFGTTVNYSTHGHASAVVVGDFNRDGK